MAKVQADHQAARRVAVCNALFQCE